MQNPTILGIKEDGVLEKMIQYVNTNKDGNDRYDMNSVQTIHCVSKIPLYKVIILVKHHLSFVVADKPCFYSLVKHKNSDMIEDEFFDDGCIKDKLIEKILTKSSTIDITDCIDSIDVSFISNDGEYEIADIYINIVGNLRAPILLAYRKSDDDYMFNNIFYSKEDLVKDALRIKIKNTIEINNEKRKYYKKINNTLTNAINEIELNAFYPHTEEQTTTK